jgi:hypothetical protein
VALEPIAAVTVDHSPYAPPASRPADGGIARPAKGMLRVGFGLGWATIAFTFLWVAVALPMLASFASDGNSLIEGLMFLALLIVPTLALLGYFARRREWMGMLGALLAWASAVALVLLLLVITLRIGPGFAD